MDELTRTAVSATVSNLEVKISEIQSENNNNNFPKRNETKWAAI